MSTPRKFRRIGGKKVRMSDATQSVTLTRSLLNIWRGKTGQAEQCMNAQCVMQNRTAFPHKVIAVVIVKSRAYIFDTPDHVWRYTLSRGAGRDIRQHDIAGVASPGTVVLRAPAKNTRLGADRRPHTGRGKPHRHHASPRIKLPRGAHARILAAANSIGKES